MKWMALCKFAEGCSQVRSIERRALFRCFVAEGAGLVDLGGQFLNPRHHPLLLRQRRQRDFASEKVLRPDSRVAGRPFGLRVQLLLKVVRVENASKPTAVEPVLANIEQKEVAGA